MDYNYVENMLLDRKPQPSERSHLVYCFQFKPGHDQSERIKTWCAAHDIKLTVFEQAPVLHTNDAMINFMDRPDMAVLFKLTFG